MPVATQEDMLLILIFYLRKQFKKNIWKRHINQNPNTPHLGINFIPLTTKIKSITISQVVFGHNRLEWVKERLSCLSAQQ